MSDQPNPAVPTPTPSSPTPSPESEPTPTPTPKEDPKPNGDEPEAASSLLGDEGPEPFDPEKLTIPEGMKKDDPLFADFTNLAKEHQISAGAAQSFIDLAAKQTAAASQKLLAEWDKQQADWQAQVRGDKEIGGDKLAATLQTFSKVANDPELSDPGFREALAFTGAGNHPAVVKTLVKWAKALSEGGPVAGEPASTRSRPATIGEAFYGPNGPHSGGPRLG